MLYLRVRRRQFRAKGEPIQMEPGFLVSNDKNNFPRGSRFKNTWLKTTKNVLFFPLFQSTVYLPFFSLTLTTRYWYQIVYSSLPLLLCFVLSPSLSLSLPLSYFSLFLSFSPHLSIFLSPSFSSCLFLSFPLPSFFLTFFCSRCCGATHVKP